MNPVRPALAVALLLHFSLEARLIPATPVMTTEAAPAVQKRTNRHVVLIEQLLSWPSYATPTCGCWARRQRLVVHDTRGLEAPRDVTPGGVPALLYSAAAFEAGDGTLFLFASGAALTGSTAFPYDRNFFSRDGGTTWLPLDTVPFDVLAFVAQPETDVGGPFTLSRGSDVRPGSEQTPFFLSTAQESLSGPAFGEIWAIRSDGAATRIAWTDGILTILGTDLEGSRVLISGQPKNSGGSVLARGIWSAALDGTLTLLALLPQSVKDGEGPVDGWITPGGGAYVNALWQEGTAPAGFSSGRAVAYVAGGVLEPVAASTSASATDAFAVPTADFSGAWILARDDSATVLSSHSPGGGLAEAWRDPTRPEVQALHAGSSGRRLLIQSHLPRSLAGGGVAYDPALAIWETGLDMPSSWDVLVVGELDAKGFAHLDVDAATEGEPFLFDYGARSGIGYAPPGTGEDAVSSWGLVRGSLRQRLVIPAAARAAGLFGSAWRTDLVLRNPDYEPARVAVRLLPNAASTAPIADATVTIPASTILTVPDTLATLFGLDSGSGALLLTPEDGHVIQATSRTYTAAQAGGTFGMSVDALEITQALAPGASASFAAGLLGDGFRTNLVATDLSGRGSAADVGLAVDATGLDARGGIFAPASAQAQLTDLAAAVGVSASARATLDLEPRDGESVIGVIAIDDETNDPSWFPPDDACLLQTRTIPAIVHVNGAYGAKFQTDLYLYNPSDRAQSVLLSANPWTEYTFERLLIVNLLPHESRTMPDAFLSAFGLGGVARLQFRTLGVLGESGGVRVTSRTYTLTSSGSTYGIAIPPLGAQQTAGAGETLEILLPAGGPRFRTNLALVELGAAPEDFTVAGDAVPVAIQVLDASGVLRDTFDVFVPPAGGVQVDDLFRARGLGDGPPSGVIRVSPAAGLVAAYATVTDNATNDPLYAPGKPVPKP